MEEQPPDASGSDFENLEYFVRTIPFEGKQASICLQRENGPCPFLAMANVLLLRAKLRSKPGVDRLKASHILLLIGDSMMENLATSTEEHIEDILSHLRDLQYGLQVNCGFADCCAFERNDGFRVFDLLNIKVLHGWIPEDIETQSVLDSMTYNEATELVALADEMQMQMDEQHDNNLNEASMSMLSKSAVIRQFLEASPSQMTYTGLFQIHAALKEGEIGVLFRNNHFSTVILNQGVLYSLVSDFGYMHQPNAVWETLESLDGDTAMVDSHFRAAATVAAEFSHIPDLGAPVMETDAAMAAHMQAEQDAALARSLQQREDAGDRGPVGKVKSQGLDENGREILVDEVGQRFIRRADAEAAAKKKKKKKPSPRRHHDTLDGDSSDSFEEESKCNLM